MKTNCLANLILEAYVTMPEMLEWKHIRAINEAIAVDYNLDKLSTDDVNVLNEICEMVLGEGM